MFTRFFDVASGGSEKTKHPVIWIELPYKYAIVYFEKVFGIDPYNVTCDCCGSDYDISEIEHLGKIGQFDLVITKKDLKTFKA